MAQLDRLLSVLAAQRADGMRMTQDEPARLIDGHDERPVTRQPLSAAQLAAIMREAAPPEMADRIQRREEAAFEYALGGETYVVEVRTEHGRLTAQIVPKALHRDRNGAGHAAPHDGPHGAPATERPRPTPPLQIAVEESGGDHGRAEFEQLLRRQLERRASDLHLRSGERPMVRVDGDVRAIDGAEPMDGAQLARMLVDAMPARNRREFEELNDTDLAYELPDGTRFRVNVFRDRRGVGAVIRAVASRVVTVEEMSITPEVQNLCQLSKGLVLVTGPTGSGKSTTLCALVDLVNRSRQDHIITIEDPIEYVHPNKGCIVTQRQVGTHTSSFKHALRAALREDPDVVLVGELRDLETVSIAIETAETGHLVFGTLHTSTAASTIDRIIDQFPADRQEQIRVMLSESLKGVVSQTLCRKKGGGRVAAREILLATPAVSNLIREAKTFQLPSVIQTSRRLGMITLGDALVELAESGQIEAAEAYSRALDKPAMAQALKNRGFDTSFIEADQAEKGGAAPRAEPAAGPGARTPVMPRPGYGTRK